MTGMKTSVTRKKGERGLHGRYEDFSDEERKQKKLSFVREQLAKARSCQYFKASGTII
ncbi:hypothetical protein [Bacillus sp. RO1]|uniref:hypothetical protein n=1 Tax=Bacillus sp. RO1 TaxID=2722703 RepID=UPI001456BFEB|nr:hypothetical protein [Bacillus sp. RO1]NLP50704.1 hypothetical protein [Bacillus sp. RO1]